MFFLTFLFNNSLCQLFTAAPSVNVHWSSQMNTCEYARKKYNLENFYFSSIFLTTLGKVETVTDDRVHNIKIINIELNLNLI